MDTSGFLSAVLATTGLPCIVTPAPDGRGFWHHPCTSTAQAAIRAEQLHAEGRDIYFAVGTLKAPKLVTILPDGTTKTQKRVAENISHWKCWIADLDIGADNPNKYTSQAEAITHLGRFCKDVGLPIPLLVSSGYGVHAYWLSATDVPAPLWQQVAIRFKALLAAYGVKADPSRTADTTSVLRVVGTSNFKDREQPKPVRILHQPTTPPLAPATFFQLVESASKRLNVATPLPPPAKRQSFDNGLGSCEAPSDPADLVRVAKACPQIHALVKTRGNVSEPHWYRAIQVVRFCEVNGTTGAKLAHYLSQGHPSYSARETDDRLDRLADYGPSLCTSLDWANPGVCTSCSHWGQIKSPIVLGHVVREAAPPVMEIHHDSGHVSKVEVPNPPEPYLRKANGALAVRIADKETGVEHVQEFYPYDIHPTKRMLDEATMTEVFYFRSWLPHDGWREYPIPANLIYDERALMATLAKKGVMPDLNFKDLVVRYMLAYMKQLQSLAPAETIYAKMGWKADDSAFVLGDTMYRADGRSSKIQLEEQYANLLKNFGQKGTLDGWKKVANAYLRPGYEDHAFVFMLGFGAPAFRFTDYEGGIVSLCGDSGAGKSTVLKLVHSIYGLPKHNVLLPQDTNNSKFAVLGAYGNLPVTYDEVTNVDADALSDLCYSVTNGRPKRRLNSDASIRSDNLSWNLPLLTSSNKSLVQTLSYKSDSSGEVMRILERHVRADHAIDYAEARKLFDETLRENYGIAGPYLISWYVRHAAETKQLLDGFINALSSKVHGHVTERYWLTMCGLALLGCHVGKKLGLHDYDEATMFQHACRIIQEARGGMASQVKTGAEVIAQYINDALPNTVVVQEPARTGGIATIVLRPRMALHVRSELMSRRIYIDRTALRNYCTKIHYNFNLLQQELTSGGLLLRHDANKRLGEDTEYLGGTSRCWVLDANHNAMAGTVNLSVIGQPVSQPQTQGSQA